MTGSPLKPKVLVVDDEPNILQSIHDLLEDDFEVVTTTDAAQAVDFLKEAGVAVILADQRMPKLSGDQFLAQAREVSDATRVLITGYVDIDALIRAVNVGQIHSYVPKPWDPASLRITVLKAASHADETIRRKKAAGIVAEQQEALARSEAAYRHQNKILQSVLDSMGDGVLVADETGKMLVLNPAAAQMVGADAREMPYAGWAERYGIYLAGGERLCPADELPLARAMRGEVADAIELFVRNGQRPDGMYVSVNVRPLKDDSGEIRGGVAVVRDVTATKSFEEELLKAKEEAERANRAKSEFLSRMSHELRTPLNSILGFAQLLALSGLADRHQDNIQHILKGGYHLLELINEVLDLARIEAGRLGLSVEPVRIEPVITEALDLVSPIAGQQNVTLSADLDGHGGLSVSADRQRLKQVLLNLLSNAIKFNRTNGHVTLTCRKTAVDRMLIEIADTGAGIDDAGLQKIFTPFERLDADRNAVAGTGLGLALSKRMIDAMGGVLGAASTPGVGSKFHIELNLAEQCAESAAEDRRIMLTPPPGCNASLEGTVLYIEDNASNVRLIAEIMSRYAGVRLLQATRGDTGLELARAHTPDWILLDLHLADITGAEVLRQLRNDARMARIPVTILSADATPGQISDLKASGARDYLTKPVNVRQLIELLEGTLRKGEPAALPNNDVVIGSESKDAWAPVWRWGRETVTLSGLPDELVEGMRTAIQDGQKGRLDELIAVVADRYPPCAAALRELADNYEYDALTNLLAGARA
ncbi:MAG TPA: response regulator [Bryobacteraceae bacterium]|nr:response regulator [Bryobacteraceae bacterium]